MFTKTIFVLAVALLPAAALAESDYWGWPYEITNCHVYALVKGQMLEFCAVDAPPDGEGIKPVKDAKRRLFSMTVRDPSTLDTTSKKYADISKAKHKLVAEQKVATKNGEFMLFKRVGPIELDVNNSLILVPIVMGTPDDFQTARGQIYVYDGARKKFDLIWETTCPEGCTDQTVQIASRPGSPESQVVYQQTIGDERKSFELKWNGRKLDPPK